VLFCPFPPICVKRLLFLSLFSTTNPYYKAAMEAKEGYNLREAVDGVEH